MSQQIGNADLSSGRTPWIAPKLSRLPARAASNSVGGAGDNVTNFS